MAYLQCDDKIAIVNCVPFSPALPYLSRWRRRGIRWLYLTIIRFILAYAAIQLSEKYSRTLLRNTKQAQSLCKTFSRRNSWKKTGPITRWPPQRLLFTQLEIVFVTIFPFTKRTKVAHKFFKKVDLLISFTKSCLRVTAPNVTEAERPFYERSQRWFLHVIRGILLQLLASVLSSHVRFLISDSNY